MDNESSSLISGDALRAAAGQYLAQLQDKAGGGPKEPLGIFDKWFIRVLTRLSSFEPGKPWEDSMQDEITRAPERAQGLTWDFIRLRLFLDRWRQGRFVDYGQRQKSGAHYYPGYGTEFGGDVLLTCQGASSFMQWRGLPLMKTAFDFAIYPQLIAELRPQTIFEIGSGSGASALWFTDHMELLDIPGRVYSVDLVPVTATHKNVTFWQGDCARPQTLFDAETLASAPHPWLVVEDAHHNVEAVLNHLHPFLKQGDYLVVEDSEIKREDIRHFLARHPDGYRVDTKYTDFFGRNATCAMDSIFVRI